MNPRSISVVGASNDFTKKDTIQTLSIIKDGYQGKFYPIHLNGKKSWSTTVAPFTTGPGSLGFASQSGTYVTQVLPYLRKKGIRYSKAISLGNEANINMVDALEYLGKDEQTKAIILYVEGIRDGRRFMEVLRKYFFTCMILSVE